MDAARCVVASHFNTATDRQTTDDWDPSLWQQNIAAGDHEREKIGLMAAWP